LIIADGIAGIFTYALLLGTPSLFRVQVRFLTNPGFIPVYTIDITVITTLVINYLMIIVAGLGTEIKNFNWNLLKILGPEPYGNPFLIFLGT